MDFDDNIGNLNVFLSKAGQGKTHAMLFHALTSKEDFLFISQEVNESFLCRRADAMINAYNIKIRGGVFKHIQDKKHIKEVMCKHTTKNVYLDFYSFDYNNYFELCEILPGRNLSLAQNLNWPFSEDFVFKKEEMIFSDQNIFKQYNVFKTNNIINVEGPQSYSLDLGLLNGL
jgi:hypothetical protein